MYSPFVYLLSDFKSLDIYLTGEYVSFEKIKSNLFLLHRDANKKIPDHYYKSKLELDFKEIKSLSSLLFFSFQNLSELYLDIRQENQTLLVKGTKFSEWQNIIAVMPPLLVQTSGLYKKYKKDFSDYQSYYDKYIIPNFLYTAIPKPNYSEMFSIPDYNGFSELHLHFNGSVETDNVWQDFLRSPDKVYKDLTKGFININVEEHFEQESHLIKPLKFYNLLKAAIKIRSILYDLIFQPNSRLSATVLNSSDTQLLSGIIFNNNYSGELGSSKHSFLHLLSNPQIDISELSLEALMYTCIFDYLNENNKHKEIVAALFHIYILIKGLSNKMLVQQESQYGFDQFQKHTFNNLRDLNEKTYHQRFYQMSGNSKDNFSFLEGRYAPKGTKLENLFLLNLIEKGWKQFKLGSKEEFPKLCVIAHFIKKKDDNKCNWIRHRNLRIEIYKKSQVLHFLRKDTKYDNLLVGFDAAANELHTPPEVFAPVFRKLKRESNEKTQFTYHAGEDFYHPLSGIRAIYEAVEFIDFGQNNRIGHATALGIDWNLWCQELNNCIHIKQGEWLDNLIFVYFLIKNKGLKSLSQLIPILEGKITRLILKVYAYAIPISTYIESWEYRKYCPILLSYDSFENARLSPVFDLTEWDEIDSIRDKTEIINALFAYHSIECRKKYDDIIPIVSDEIIKEKQFEQIQLHVLEILAKKKVIIETLPTSNVRISHYKDHSQHHVFRWLKWKEEGKSIPEIVVGADDTGIFSTNIFNEYAHIYGQLTQNNFGLANQPISYIKELIATSEKIRFTART